MGIKLVFFISIVNSLFSYHLFEAAPVKKSTVIVDIIANDSEAGANKSVVYQSQYLQQTCNVRFPDASSDIKDIITFNQYLCTALYDRSIKLHHLQTIEKKDLFTNQTAFDGEVNKIITDYNQLYPVCGNWQNNLTSEYSVTKPFVNKLDDYLKDVKNCANKCAGKNSTINPLCAMIYYIDKTMKISQNNSKPEEVVKNVSVPKSEDAVTDNADKPKSVVTPNEPVSTNNKNDIEKEKKIDEEKKDDTQKPANSGISTTKNDGIKLNPENPGNKTTAPTNEQTNKGVDTPLLDKKEDISNTAVEKPDTIVDQNAEEDTIQHSEGDFFPDEGNDQVQLDDEDKMNDQEHLVKPDDKTDSLLVPHDIEKDDGTHFFAYFPIIGLLGICSCLAYHHKQKILAILLEGRRSRGGRGRRRPSTASYRKLDCTLEEAVTSQCNANVTHVIY